MILEETDLRNEKGKHSVGYVLPHFMAAPFWRRVLASEETEVKWPAQVNPVKKVTRLWMQPHLFLSSDPCFSNVPTVSYATHMNGFSAMKNLCGKNYLDISTIKTSPRGLTHLGIKLPSHSNSVRLKADSECERAPYNSHANRGDCQERQRV